MDSKKKFNMHMKMKLILTPAQNYMSTVLLYQL